MRHSGTHLSSHMHTHTHTQHTSHNTQHTSHITHIHTYIHTHTHTYTEGVIFLNGHKVFFGAEYEDERVLGNRNEFKLPRASRNLKARRIDTHTHTHREAWLRSHFLMTESLMSLCWNRALRTPALSSLTECSLEKAIMATDRQTHMYKKIPRTHPQRYF